MSIDYIDFATPEYIEAQMRMYRYEKTLIGHTRKVHDTFLNTVAHTLLIEEHHSPRDTVRVLASYYLALQYSCDFTSEFNHELEKALEARAKLMRAEKLPNEFSCMLEKCIQMLGYDLEWSYFVEDY